MAEGTLNRLGVVILHWHTEQETTACLANVAAFIAAQDMIFLVDNGSDGRLGERIQARFGRIRVLGDARNIGYAAGVNIGIRAALAEGCSHVLLINNDALLESGTRSALLEAPVGIVSPVIVGTETPPRIWFGGGTILYWGRGLHRTRRKRRVDGRMLRTTGYATGCAMLIHRTVFETIGLFDERFFAYSEDVDFCIRARRNGIPLYLHDGIFVRHAQSQSVKQNAGREFRDYYVLRNTLLLLRKHFTGPDRFLRMLTAVLMEYLLPALFFLLVRRTPRRVRALTQALRDGWNDRAGKRWSDVLQAPS